MTTAPSAGHALGLTISPASTHLFGATAQHYTGHMTVENPGALPITVTITAQGLTPTGASCTIPHTAPAWLTVQGGGGQHFQLLHGQEHVTTYVVDAAPGTVDSAAIVASAVPSAHQAGAAARLNVAEGSRVTLNSTSRCHAAPLSLPAHGGGGIPAADLAIIPLVIVVAAAAIVIRRRHNTRKVAQQ